MGSEALMILANFLVCTFGAWVCTCRMAKMSATETKPEIRAQYAIWTGLFTASAISWTWGDAPDVMQLLMSLSIVTHLLLGTSAWRSAAPAYTHRSAT